MGLKFFLSSVILSLGAVVFGQNKEEEMATRPVVPNQNRGIVFFHEFCFLFVFFFSSFSLMFFVNDASVFMFKIVPFWIFFVFS